MQPNQNQPEQLERIPVHTEKNPYELENRIKSGANWFYWIAALSFVNSLIILFGMEWNFIIGLGITQIIDSIAWGISEETGSGLVRFIALFADLAVISIIAAFGYFAREKKDWGFITGMVLYGLDTLFFILVLDFIGIAFHGLALYFIYGGYKALKEQLKIQPVTNPAMVNQQYQQQSQQNYINQ